MLTLDQLRERITLPSAAQRLGLKMHSDNGDQQLWSRPDTDRPEITINLRYDFWREAKRQDGGGHIIDLTMWAMGLDYPKANKALHALFHLHYLPAEDAEPEESDDRDKLHFIASQCLHTPEKCLKYLVEERGIPEPIIRLGIQHKTLGWTNYTNPRISRGEQHYGGEAASFISYMPDTKVLAAVDYRYYDPELNGGMKTKSLGKKNGVYWTLDPRAVRTARTIYVVEGPLDALSIEAAFANDKYVCAIALRGTQVSLNWQMFAGKTVISCYDKDEPKPDKRNPNGPLRSFSAEAEWRIHEACLAAGVSCFFVDRAEWEYGQDANDIWKEKKHKSFFQRLEPWLIPGLGGKSNNDDERHHKARLYLPFHDVQQYWRFRVKTDFTSYIKLSKNDDGEEREIFEDVSGFRVAGLSRVEVASATATMTGDQDTSPRVQFVAMYQSPRHGATLQRRVMEDEQLHNLDHWRKAGPIFMPAKFSRMLSIFERAIGIGSIHAANFVGVCYLNGEVRVNEGKDCFFTEPKQQCPYHAMSFPRGPRHHAAEVVEAYQSTFKSNAAAMVLTWVVGAQLKIFLGFWPHMIMQAGKGSGKSTLVNRIERTTGMTMFSGQTMGTEYRLLTSISGTSHPIGWDELSARKSEIIHRAVSLLQESYQYTETTRGSAQTPFLICAPVLLAGEDVPVESLTGKTVRTDLTNRKGPLMREDLPKFPMYEWAQWLTKLGKTAVKDCYATCLSKCQMLSRARENDSGAQRMIHNYAALMTAWRLISTFAGLYDPTEEFERDLLADMNSHIADTNNDREPWIWIVEIIADEIAAGRYPYPYVFEKDRETDPAPTFFCIRVNHMMAHLSTSVALREKYNNMPVKTGRILKKQITEAGVINDDSVARSIDGRRVSHMQRLDIGKLEQYGISVTPPEQTRAHHQGLL